MRYLLGIVFTLVFTSTCFSQSWCDYAEYGWFKRGDVNSDGVVDVTDVTLVLPAIYSGWGPPCNWDAVDTNDDGQLDTTDQVYLADAIFNGGPLPPAPYPAMGEDPTADNIQNSNSPRPGGINFTQTLDPDSANCQSVTPDSGEPSFDMSFLQIIQQVGTDFIRIVSDNFECSDVTRANWYRLGWTAPTGPGHVTAKAMSTLGSKTPRVSLRVELLVTGLSWMDCECAPYQNSIDILKAMFGDQVGTPPSSFDYHWTRVVTLRNKTQVGKDYLMSKTFDPFPVHYNQATYNIQENPPCELQGEYGDGYVQSAGILDTIYFDSSNINMTSFVGSGAKTTDEMEVKSILLEPFAHRNEMSIKDVAQWEYISSDIRLKIKYKWSVNGSDPRTDPW